VAVLAQWVANPPSGKVRVEQQPHERLGAVRDASTNG
jgi:hypothetical protein